MNIIVTKSGTLGGYQMIISCLPWRSSTFKRIQDNHLHYKREFQSGMAIHFSETLQKRKKTSDLISSEMAGSSPSSRSPASHCGHITMATLLLVLMGCQQYAVFAAPVAHEAPLSDRDSSQTARKLLQWMLEHSFPTSSSALSSELQQTQFYPLVCPMLVNYTRFNFTLKSVSENNTNYIKLSLVTFLLKKSTELTCEHVKRNCTSGECSNLECTTLSIAKHCLQAPAHALAQGFGPTHENIVLETARQLTLIPSWIRENMAGRDPGDGLLETLKTVLSEVAFLRCTGSRAEDIMCNHFLGF